MQKQITQKQSLLNESGMISEPGYATHPVWQYDRKLINAGKSRIKEWDYYHIIDQQNKRALTLTIADLGYMGLIAVCYLDFKQAKSWQTDQLLAFPMGKMNLPAYSGESEFGYQNKNFNIRFEIGKTKRKIEIEVNNFKYKTQKMPLKAAIEMDFDLNDESMVIASSWKENPTAFYYNHKIPCMQTKGSISIGDKNLKLDPSHSTGGLDWGRGNWTYKNRWFWGSLGFMHAGKELGINMGYGFSDRSKASENMILYNGKAHKLEDITFHFDVKNFMNEWRFTSSDNRLNLVMKPLLDRQANTNLLFIKSVQHQVFGTFTGEIILDDNTIIEIHDKIGFAEDVLNWW